jgi:GAF domain-containing protein
VRPAPGFDEDAVAKVTILAAQLGTALEALRLNQLSREEHRRASILVEVATALHGLPDTAAVMESIADRLRVLLHSPAVLVFHATGKAVPVAGGVDRGSRRSLSPSARVSSRMSCALRSRSRPAPSPPASALR